MNTEKSHGIGPESDETRRTDGNLTARERAMLAAVCQWEADNQHGGRPSWTREIRLAAEAAKGADGGQ